MYSSELRSISLLQAKLANSKAQCKRLRRQLKKLKADSVPLPDLDALIECMRPIITSNHWDGGQLADAIIAWLKDQPAPKEPSHE